MNYNLLAAGAFFLAGVVFILTGNTATGTVFIPVGAVFVALATMKKKDPPTRD